LTLLRHKKYIEVAFLQAYTKSSTQVEPLPRVYMNDVISDLRNSGYGLHIGKDFVGCIIHADDILLLSCSCHGIQRLVDICMDYCKTWDMCFNAKKTQCITFGGTLVPLLKL